MVRNLRANPPVRPPTEPRVDYRAQFHRDLDSLETLMRTMASRTSALLLRLGDDPRHLAWALRMLQVSRYLERAADHAVDIAEQAWFLMTGELRELD